MVAVGTPPPTSTLGTEGYILLLTAQPLLLLPPSWGGALDPFGLPQRIITPALYTLPAHNRSGVGDLAGVTESQAPGVSALGRSLVSGGSEERGEAETEQGPRSSSGPRQAANAGRGRSDSRRGRNLFP